MGSCCTVDNDEQEPLLSISLPHVSENENSTTCKGARDLDCPSLLRLIDALQKYESNMSEEDFISFIEDVYGTINVLNDFNHLILCHNDNLQRINERMLASKKCLFKECKCVHRHFENESDCFYVSVFDSLHVWLYHCFDAGFRLKQSENEMIEFDADCLFDAEFDRINKAIRLSDMLTAPFERINNAKFSICTTTKGDTTFIDELFRHLTSECGNVQSIQKLIVYLRLEEFDTDSVETDIKEIGGNIVYATTKECIDEIIRFIKVNGSTFSVGLRYYYWKWYEHRESIEQNNHNNYHDHSGHTVYQLYVRRKYFSLKEEALNYKDFDVNMYEIKTIKANKYLQTDKIKQLRAKDIHTLHSGIKRNAVIEFGHLFALVLYCDLTKLSTEFSSTFRKITKYETLKSMKQRNALFYWMSKYLRGLVEIFGQCSYGDTFKKDEYGFDDRRKPLDALRGNFYCGMNCKMNVDAFMMRLNGPTSTSKQFEVAVKFSGDVGMIFTFDNPKNDVQYCNLRGFNCSFISCFKQEDEVLFFGGLYPIKMTTVRLMETKHNFKIFVEAIWYFDSMITGAYMGNIQQRKNTHSIISNLINYVLKKPVKAIFDEYIIDIFLCYANNKKQIILDLYHLHTCEDRKMTSLILSPLDGETKGDEADLRNLFSSDLLRIFPNTQTVIIDSTLVDSYSFSLVALLIWISESNLKKIIIKGAHKGWIKKKWNSEKANLKATCSVKEFTISFEEKDDHDCLLIRKKEKSIPAFQRISIRNSHYPLMI